MTRLLETPHCNVEHALPSGDTLGSAAIYDQPSTGTALEPTSQLLRLLRSDCRSDLVYGIHARDDPAVDQDVCRDKKQSFRFLH